MSLTPRSRFREKRSFHDDPRFFRIQRSQIIDAAPPQRDRDLVRFFRRGVFFRRQPGTRSLVPFRLRVGFRLRDAVRSIDRKAREIRHASA
jgi:hypothetical protein